MLSIVRNQAGDGIAFPHGTATTTWMVREHCRAHNVEHFVEILGMCAISLCETSVIATHLSTPLRFMLEVGTLTIQFLTSSKQS